MAAATPRSVTPIVAMFRNLLSGVCTYVQRLCEAHQVETGVDFMSFLDCMFFVLHLIEELGDLGVGLTPRLDLKLVCWVLLTLSTLRAATATGTVTVTEWGGGIGPYLSLASETKFYKNKYFSVRNDFIQKYLYLNHKNQQQLYRLHTICRIHQLTYLVTVRMMQLKIFLLVVLQ